jgi:hypothetical protein
VLTSIHKPQCPSFKTSAIHEYSELSKYSCTTEHTWLFPPSVKLYQCPKDIFFKNTTETEMARSVNGDDTSDNAT